MAKKSKSPNDEPRPQSGRKAKLNSRNTPDKYSTTHLRHRSRSAAVSCRS